MKKSSHRILSFSGVALAMLLSVPAAQELSEGQGPRSHGGPEGIDFARLTLRAADFDRDGAVNPREWARYMTGLGFDADGLALLHEPQGQALIHVLNTNTSPGLEVADLRAALQRLDKDGNGVLTPPELKGPRGKGEGEANAEHPGRGQGEHPEHGAERDGPRAPGARLILPASLLVARAADLDKDGVVSRKERASFLKDVPTNRRGRLDPEVTVQLLLSSGTPRMGRSEGRRGDGEHRGDGERRPAAERGQKGEGDGQHAGPRVRHPFLVLGHFLDPNGDDKVAQGRIAELFLGLDKNADGALDRSELGGGRGAPGKGAGQRAGEGRQQSPGQGGRRGR